MDTKSMESQDADIIENAVVALREIWKKKLLVLLITIAGFIMSVLIINMKGNTTRYYSSASLFSAVYGSYSDTTEGVAAMNRYADLISSSRVSNRAAQALTGFNISAQDIQKMVSDGYIKVIGASNTATTYGYKLTISVFADKQELSVPLVNAMASAFAKEVNDLIGSDVIQVMDEATQYSTYKMVNIPLQIALFTGGAFILACVVIFVIEFFSPWVRSVEQCEQNGDLVLGMQPYIKKELSK